MFYILHFCKMRIHFLNVNLILLSQFTNMRKFKIENNFKINFK